MMVEFVGAAGVGKTYLSERVLEALQARGLAARNFNRIDKRRAGARSLVLLARAIYVAARMRQKSPPMFSRTVETIWKYSILREVGKQLEGIHVTSEGFFHKIIMFHRRSDVLSVDQVADLLFRSVEPADVVVVVEAGAETIFARRSARNRANDRFTPESVKADIAVVEQAVGAMEHVRRSRSPGMQVLRVSAEEEGGDGAVATIVAAVERSANAAPARY